MNVDVENITIKKQKHLRPIYKVIDNSFSVETRLFPTEFLYQCKNNPNNLQNIPSGVKVYF